MKAVALLHARTPALLTGELLVASSFLLLNPPDGQHARLHGRHGALHRLRLYGPVRGRLDLGNGGRGGLARGADDVGLLVQPVQLGGGMGGGRRGEGGKRAGQGKGKAGKGSMLSKGAMDTVARLLGISTQATCIVIPGQIARRPVPHLFPFPGPRPFCGLSPHFCAAPGTFSLKLAEAAAAAVLMRSRVLRDEVATWEVGHAERSTGRRAFRASAREKADALDERLHGKGC